MTANGRTVWGHEGPPAIELVGVGKRFTKYEDTPMLLTSAARLRRRTRREKLWAVQDVDLRVPRGASYGIIGRNGSGKTTLLSMMAGVTAPSRGSLRAWGRIAPLIAVGVGFHRELTGRENVYLNATMLGLTRPEIDARLEAIVEFSEIGDFLDTPVKFYSSGMYVRLGFSVAIHCDPDILLVDEVLAVGDLGFQMKCFERMRRLRERGTTIVVVSHNLPALQAITEQVLVMHKSRPQFFGPPTEAIARFHELLEQESELHVDRVSGLRYEPGVLQGAEISVLDEDGAPTAHVLAGSEITLQLTADALADVDGVTVAFSITGPEGQLVYNDTSGDRSLGPVPAGERAVFTMSLGARLPTGTYSVHGWIGRTDLRTLLSRSRPTSLYVSGRLTVTGAADLGGHIARRPADGALSVPGQRGRSLPTA